MVPSAQLLAGKPERPSLCKQMVHNGRQDEGDGERGTKHTIFTSCCSSDTSLSGSASAPSSSRTECSSHTLPGLSGSASSALALRTLLSQGVQPISKSSSLLLPRQGPRSNSP